MNSFEICKLFDNFHDFFWNFMNIFEIHDFFPKHLSNRNTWEVTVSKNVRAQQEETTIYNSTDISSSLRPDSYQNMHLHGNEHALW